MNFVKRLNLLLAKPLIGFVWGYKKLISPLLAPSCIYYPSCSDYSRQALIRHGLVGGAYLTISRLLRCHPWRQSGIDEVPENFSLFKK